MKPTSTIFSIAHRRQLLEDAAIARHAAQADAVRVLAHLRHERRLREAEASLADMKRAFKKRPAVMSAFLDFARMLLAHVRREEGPANIAAANLAARAIEECARVRPQTRGLAETRTGESPTERQHANGAPARGEGGRRVGP